MYVRELRVQYRLRRLPGRESVCARFNSPADAAALLLRILQHEPVEVCGLLCLSTAHELLAYHELSRGTLDGTMVHPRDVFRAALLTNARAVIVGHNHPSGDPIPSADDIRLTRRLRQAGELLGLDLQDHIIVGHDRYVSFRETGIL